MIKNKLYLFCVIIFLISACSTVDDPETQVIYEDDAPSGSNLITPTPFSPVLNERNPETIPNLWIPDYLNDVPMYWLDDSQIVFTKAKRDAACSLQVKNEGEKVGYLTFAFVKPFNTIQDQISKELVLQMLMDENNNQTLDGEVYVSEPTYKALSEGLGNLSENIKIVPEPELFESVGQSSANFAVIRFDHLDPQWKVLRIENISPFDKKFDRNNYWLNFPIHINCSTSEINRLIKENLENEISNRSDEKITSILITGTTALTRATADRMEKYGNSYPGEKIKIWFENSDIRHISSETVFYSDCPPPNPVQENLIFCSQPKYSELFNFLSVDIIELTGNHLLDKGIDPFENTLVLFDQLGLKYYAAGYSKEEAQEPLLLEHNDNHFAFLGCNQAGPANVWATDTRSGVNACDYEMLTEKIRLLKTEGYIPIVTFQYFESNTMRASSSQMREFRKLVDAGAVIISGSQSHVPMSMEIYHGAFIHYGLGNLFFDQMDSISNRREFLDRHIFYDGRYIGTELLAAMLENYAQPRPMTDEEKENLLQDAFDNFTIVKKDEK